MNYEELLMLKKQFEAAKITYLSRHPEELDMLDKRLAIDMFEQETNNKHCHKQITDNYNSLVKAIADELQPRVEIFQKEYLSAREVAKYLGVSLSHIHKLTMDKKIPFFKPLGKVLYFRREEIDNWIQQSRQS